ncbi:MAG: hypothetical protein BMS9Abin36_2167 [Gammaproteobacteria bacterium]|nr:MAG: hypothetical protein BMS9Abin36_2167 [Gammaproteobacteria bacterium]
MGTCPHSSPEPQVNMSRPRRLALFLSIFLLAHSALSRADGQDVEIKLVTGTEVPMTVFPAKSFSLILWLPSEFGFKDGHRALAQELSQQHYEVWLADIIQAHLLAPVPSSIDRVPTEDLTALIAFARKKTGKKVYVLTSSRGAVMALRGLQPIPKAVKGVILFSPNLYIQTPEPGKVARYQPIINKTRLNLAIIQPQNSPWYWYRDVQTRLLEQAGSRVYNKVLTGVRDRFYFRPDSTDAEDRMAKLFPAMIRETISYMENY